MKVRPQYWLVVGAAMLLGAVWLVQRGPTLHPSVPVLEPLAIVPPGPAFVLSADLRRLRTTPAGLALARAGSERFSKANKPCGFDPLRDVEQVVVAVPSDAKLAPGSALPESNAVAVIASGRFVGPVVADCIARQIAERGGEPVRTTIGSFASVRDRRTAGEIAIRNGLLVLSDGAYLRLVLDAAEGHQADGSEAERIRDRLHAELRRSFGGQAPIIGTLTLPEGTLERALAEPGTERSPLTLVRSAALRADVGERIDVRTLFACAKPEHCEPVERFLNHARLDFGAAFGPEFAKRLAELKLVRTGERIELDFAIEAAQVRDLFSGPRPADSR